MRPIDINNVVIETDLPLPRYARGKVRDTYLLGENSLRVVSTDRVSAFDYVLPNGIPHKGEILNKMSRFWLERTSYIIPNHLIRMEDERTMDVKKAKRFPIEAVVRGYLYGSAEEAYRKDGSCCGVVLPPGLQKAEKLPQSIFTPTTKAESGHDEPLTMEQVSQLIGPEFARDIHDKSIDLYEHGRETLEPLGIIVADTKFEFGLFEGKLILIDEVLTPDSSRFWPRGTYVVGKDQASYDKQPLRDWLANVAKWDKKPPAPQLPPEIVIDTSRIYMRAYESITGELF